MKVVVSFPGLRSHNQLASAPVGLFRLENLASLALHFNQLESLPEDLGRLRSLSELVNARTLGRRPSCSLCSPCS